MKEGAVYDALFNAFEQAAVFSAAGSEIRIYPVQQTAAEDASGIVNPPGVSQFPYFL